MEHLAKDFQILFSQSDSPHQVLFQSQMWVQTWLERWCGQGEIDKELQGCQGRALGQGVTWRSGGKKRVSRTIMPWTTIIRLRSRTSLYLDSPSRPLQTVCKMSTNIRESLWHILHFLSTWSPFFLTPRTLLWARVKSSLSQPAEPHLLLTWPCDSAQETEVGHN